MFWFMFYVLCVVVTFAYIVQAEKTVTVRDLLTAVLVSLLAPFSTVFLLLYDLDRLKSKLLDRVVWEKK